MKRRRSDRIVARTVLPVVDMDEAPGLSDVDAGRSTGYGHVDDANAWHLPWSDMAKVDPISDQAWGVRKFTVK